MTAPIIDLADEVVSVVNDLLLPIIVIHRRSSVTTLS